MVTFRKSFLLLAVLTLVATVASAQTTPAFQCTANAGVPPLIRAEGLAELVGDVVLNCTGGTPTLAGATVPLVNFRVFLNTNVTSWLVNSPVSEAFLMIDDPAPADQQICTGLCNITGVGGEPGVNYSNEYNVWPGTYITGNTASEGNTLEWLGIPIDPPGTTSTRIIRITNVRVNAAQKGVGGGLIPSQVNMYISATGTTSLPINNPNQLVAFVQKGMTFSADAASYLQCEVPSGTTYVKYQEMFATAFKRRNVATTDSTPTGDADQNVPGSIYNTESGFINSAFGVYANSGEATQGTRLVARFTNIPSGVTLQVGNENYAGTNHAALVASADSNGYGGTPMTYTGSTAMTTLTVSGEAATATWEILTDNPITVDNVYFYIQITYTPNTTAGIPGLGSGSVAGSYGPVSDIIAATSTDIQPRFIDDSEAVVFLTINSCATNLLWPYVTNQAGFDTGMVISNTSLDPFLTATQEGACEIYYYGNSNGGAAPPMDTTPVVPAGQYAIWVLSSGGTVKTAGGTIAAAPGFEGYVIAHCLFQYAHGYAFISDLGAQKLAQGFVALVMDAPMWCGPWTEGSGGSCDLTRTGSRSEPLNQ